MAKTRIIDLSELKPDEANAREHDQVNLAAIRNSLERFGSGRSIVVDGNDVVRAGNGTIEAAKAAGMNKVLVVEPDADTLVAVKRADWSEQEAKGYGVADNRAAELAKWNLIALQDIINSTPDIGPESLGFTQAQLQDLFNEFDVPTTDMPGLPDGEPERTKMSFVLTSVQAQVVGQALERAVEAGEAAAGKKGEALAAVCEGYLES